MKFEHKSKPLLSQELYIQRVLRYAGFALALLGVSMGIGVLGYRYLNDLSWTDSFLNASMILAGMGPVDPMTNNAAKWFATFYAIFSGVAFLSTVAVFFSPIVHRFLHKLNLDEADEKKTKR